MWATVGVVVLILLENQASSVARSGWSGFNFEGKKTNGSLQMTINFTLTGFNKCNGDAIAWMIFFTKERPLANNLSCADIPWKFNDTHITRTYNIPRVTLPMNCKKYLGLCSCSMWNIFPLLPEGIQIQAGMWHCNQSQRISINVTSLETSPLKASCGQIENSCKTSHEYGILGNETNMFRPEFFNTYLVEYFSNENCYQHSKDVFCYVKFPGCNTSGLLDLRFICKETCEEALRGCSGVIRRMSGATTWKICDIYPSYLHDRFCWYKKVNCGIPPSVANSKSRNTNSTTFSTTAEYKCASGYKMEGNGLITCLPNGKWQDAPRCINAESKVPLIIPIGTGVGSFVVILVVLIGCIKRKRLQRFWLNKRRPIRLKRAQKNSEHAVFIFYISSDESFVLDTLLNLFQNDRTWGGFEIKTSVDVGFGEHFHNCCLKEIRKSACVIFILSDKLKHSHMSEDSCEIIKDTLVLEDKGLTQCLGIITETGKFNDICDYMSDKKLLKEEKLIDWKSQKDWTLVLKMLPNVEDLHSAARRVGTDNPDNTDFSEHNVLL